MTSMRTTLTLDDDVAIVLREEAERSGLPFKQVVNQTIRLGLRAAGTRQTAPEPFRTVPRAFGFKPGIDPDRLNQIADELEAEEFRRQQGVAG